MSLVSRLAPCLFTTAALALAQSSSPVASGPAVQAPKVVVQDTRLSADAAGTTVLALDDTIAPEEQTLANLTTRVANLHIDAGGAGSFGDLVSLRGLTNTPYFSDPSVILYFDDIPLGSSFTYPTGLFGFSTATIARGPQGSAYGRGGEGGVIALASPEPGDQASGQVRGSYGNHNTRTAALEATSAKGSQVDATFAGSYLQRDGYINNTTLGTWVDNQEVYSGSARVRYRPVTGAEFTLELLGNRQRDGSQPLVPLGGPLFSVARGREGSTDTDFGAAAFKMAFDTPAGLLTSTTSRTEWLLSPYDNRLTLPPTLDSKIVQAQRAWNEELKLASSPRADAAWNLGAWFSDTNTHGDVNRAIPGLFPIEVSNYVMNAHTAAAFGNVTFALTPALKLALGLRAEETAKTFYRAQQVPGPGQFASSKNFYQALPKASLSYALDNNTTASFTASQGAKPGGWSAYTGNANLAPFRQEKATDYEAGIDTMLADNKVRLATRIFYYDISNYQIERSFNASDYLVVNAPKARSFGGEVETTWRPVKELTVAATLGITEVTLRQFVDPFTGANYSGNRAPYAPLYNAEISATWRPVADWFATAEVVRTGKTYFDESERSAFAERAYTVANLRLGYDTAQWRFDVYGDNLFDEGYYTIIVPGVGHAAPGAPRTYGAEVVWKW